MIHWEKNEMKVVNIRTYQNQFVYLISELKKLKNIYELFLTDYWTASGIKKGKH